MQRILILNGLVDGKHNSTHCVHRLLNTLEINRSIIIGLMLHQLLYCSHGHIFASERISMPQLIKIILAIAIRIMSGNLYVRIPWNGN
ncbi:hypothetical protein D3C80_2036390 [compost metagenome]